MQTIFFLLIGLFFVFLESKQKIIKNIKTIKNNRKNIKHIEYYREKIDDYSPLIYAKLLNKRITNSDVIISMILFLEEKNIIDIDSQNNIIIKNNANLKEHEKFFIEKIKFIFYDLYHNTKTKYIGSTSIIKKLEQLIYEDMIKEGLIDLKNKKSSLINFIEKENYINISEIFPLIYNILALSFIMSNFGTIIFWSTTFIFILINVIKIIFNLKIDYLKTEFGHKCTEKLKAQKRFLKKFTLISTREIKDKVIWESYIRNAIFLNLKGKLDNDSIQYYKNILNKYNYIGLENKHKDILFVALLSTVLLLPWILLFFAGDNIMKTFICAFLVTPLIFIFLIYECAR